MTLRRMTPGRCRTWDEARQAGLVLEAKRSKGRIVIQQAAIGARVRRLRIAAGVGQVNLAEQVGLASGAISMLENGRYPADKVLLDKLARALDCSPQHFTALHREPLVSPPWLRAYADASKRSVDRLVADSTLALETAEYLGLQRIPDGLPLFVNDPSDDDGIEQFAAEVRAAAGLADDDVVGNMTRAAERLGCVVLPMENELGRHLGLSLRADGTAVVRVSRPSDDPDRDVPGDRQRFTIAHELGHLVLHHACPPPVSAADAMRVEKQAHRFAAAFLAPADPIVADLERLGGRVTLTTLAELKKSWGMAIKAFVVRFQHLGVIDSNHARSLYKQLSARRWNKEEPVPVGNEDAVWLYKAMQKKARTAGDPLATLARESGLGEEYLRRWTDWTPTARQERNGEVVPLRGRVSRVTATGSGRGSVAKMPVRNLQQD